MSIFSAHPDHDPLLFYAHSSATQKSAGTGGLPGARITGREQHSRKVGRIVTRLRESNGDVPAASVLCNTLRSEGVPARLRYGFARYLGTQVYPVRLVCEYWHEWELRWVTVDPDVSAAELTMRGFRFSPLDVPRSRFVTAGKAWQMCRIWGANPRRFGIHPHDCGLHTIVAQLLRDFSALNREDLPATDAEYIASGLLDSTLEDTQMLDHVAIVTLAANTSFQQMRALYCLNPAMHNANQRREQPSYLYAPASMLTA